MAARSSVRAGVLGFGWGLGFMGLRVVGWVFWVFGLRSSDPGRFFGFRVYEA